MTVKVGKAALNKANAVDSRLKAFEELAIGKIFGLSKDVEALNLIGAFGATKLGKAAANVVGKIGFKSVKPIVKIKAAEAEDVGAALTKIADGAKSATNAHKNSLAYQGPTHVYKITDAESKVLKIGESATGLTKQGLSKRAQQQVKVLNKTTGREHDSEIIAHFGGKKEARIFETETIIKIKESNPNALPLNKGIH